MIIKVYNFTINQNYNRFLLYVSFVISLYLQFEKMLYHSFLDLLQSVEGEK